jgi:hypothetical protein
MKRIIIALILCAAGMTIFAQGTDLSYYTNDFKRSNGTFRERLAVLETVRNLNRTGIGDFYHDALKFFLTRLPEIRTREDRDTAEDSARLLCQELGAENYNAAASEIWELVQFFDVARDVNQGLVMHDALKALGQINAQVFVPHIVQRLTDFNTQRLTDVETRRRIQRGVSGSISALEALHDPSGFRPVFFASVGSYDTSIKALASVALPNIVEDPGEIIGAIIRDTSISPDVKYVAWQEMLRTNAPDSSKARVAAEALATGWNYSSSVPIQQRDLRSMRRSAINTIRHLGAADNSVYLNLERSYSGNFNSGAPDFEEIHDTLNALSALKTEEAVQLLLKFLRELHLRRRDGPWAQKERQVFQWILPLIGATRTQNEEMKLLLTTIQRTDSYTGTEQGWARSALNELGQ